MRETVARFREEAEEIEAVYYLYVLEEEKLLGVVGLRDLLLEDQSKTLGEVMHTKLITIP